jgi:hypothetical protein
LYEGLVDKGSNFRKDTLSTHDSSGAHGACMKADQISKLSAEDKMKKTAIGAGLLRMTANERTRYQCLFNTAYAVARKAKPTIDYEYICCIQKKNGLNLGNSLLNDDAAAEMIKFMAEDMRRETRDRVKKAHYMTVLADGSTDEATIEQEVVMVRYFDKGIGEIRTDFVAMMALEHAHADGVYAGIKGGLDELLKEKGETPNHEQLGIIGGNFDGASVMMGARNGVKAKLAADYPWVVVIHCIAHKLELGVLDAVKEVPYLKEFEAHLKEVIKLYQFSPKRRRDVAKVAEEYNSVFRNFDDINKVRWVASKERAVKTMLLNLPVLDNHLQHMATLQGNNDERDRARGLVDSVISARFVKWLHLMADFLDVITKVSKKFQFKNLLIIEVPGIIENLHDALLNMENEPGPNMNSFNMKYDEDLSTFGDIPLRNKRQTRTSHDPRALTNVDEGGDLLLQSAVEYIDTRFAVLNEPPLSYFKVLNFKFWPRGDDALRTFGNKEIAALLDHFSVVLTAGGCNVEKAKTQWCPLKRYLVNMRSSDLTSAYADLVKSAPEDFEDITHLIIIMMTLSPSTAECERQFSGKCI